MTHGFQVGITTREDLLLRLGEPDATLNNQSVFLYSWTRTRGYLIIAYYDVFAAGKTTMLLFEFDADNYLKRFERISPSFFSGTSIMGEAQKWSSEDIPAKILPDEKQ